MLAARQEQENLIHEHQTAAAIKPLNQEGSGIAPKTPCNNGSKARLQTAARGDENATFVTKGNKLQFITPAAPRERAPLGAKTTNAKTKAFQTPAPLTGARGLPKTQRKSASGRKQKLKVHQPEAVEADPITQEDEHDEDVPDVEYCPPKITELPDPPYLPYAFGPEDTFPQFDEENMHKGWYTWYCNPIGEDGLSQTERERKKRREDIDKWEEEEFEKAKKEQDEYFGLPSLVIDEQSSSATTSKPVKKQAPSTAKSRAAVAALSHKPQPSYAAPTLAAKAKSSIAPVVRRDNKAHIASRSTMGYAKGRKVSASLREKNGIDANDISQNNNKPKTFWDNFEKYSREFEEEHGTLSNQAADDLSDDDDDYALLSCKIGLKDLLQDQEPFQFNVDGRQ